jgi:hypothetical protein
MIRRSPAEVYIKYLILHPRRYSNEDIRDILEFAQLDFVGNWYVDKIRGTLTPPDPFHPFDAKHALSSRYLLAQGLAWIFHPDEHGRRAFTILERPRIKEFVETMVVANAPAVAISHACTKQHRFECSSVVIERYRYFFWNVDLVDSTELRALLQLRFDNVETHRNPEVASTYKAVRSASYKDARKTAADLPFSPLSAMIAQMRMGASPSKLDVAMVLHYSQKMAVARLAESLSNNAKGDSSRALDFSTVIEKVTNSIEKIVTPDAQLRDQLAAIAMRTDDTPLPSIHALSLGRHTVEVTQMETTNDLPADFDDGDGGDDAPLEPG